MLELTQYLFSFLFLNYLYFAIKLKIIIINFIRLQIIYIFCQISYTIFITVVKLYFCAQAQNHKQVDRQSEKTSWSNVYSNWLGLKFSEIVRLISEIYPILVWSTSKNHILQQHFHSKTFTIHELQAKASQLPSLTKLERLLKQTQKFSQAPISILSHPNASFKTL